MTRILLVFLGLSFSSFAFSAAASAGKATEKTPEFRYFKRVYESYAPNFIKVATGEGIPTADRHSEIIELTDEEYANRIRYFVEENDLGDRPDDFTTVGDEEPRAPYDQYYEIRELTKAQYDSGLAYEDHLEELCDY